MHKFLREMKEQSNSVELLKGLVDYIDYSIDDERISKDMFYEIFEVINEKTSKTASNDLDIMRVEYNYSVDVLIVNTAIRFKVREFFNKKDFSCEVKVENNKTFLKISGNFNVEKLKEIEKDLEELKVWSADYVSKLDEQSEEAELKDVNEGELTYLELKEEKRIIVKVHYNDRFTFKNKFSSAKWDAEFKAWRVSNMKSNIEKLKELENVLTKI